MQRRRPGRIRQVCLLLAPWLPVLTASGAGPDSSADAGILGPASTIQGPVTVGAITIVNDSIFDLTDPNENGVLYRLANRAHITTRPRVIEQQLLFREGDVVPLTTIEETERILRSNRYLQDASIKAAPQEDGTVDLTVRTSDVWTLVPRISFSRSGGENGAAAGIKETNLLGTGTAVELLYKTGVDRDEKIVRFSDSQLGDSWYGLGAAYADNSDGHSLFVDFGKPFYSLDSTGAHGIRVQDDDRIDSLYENGEIASQYRHRGETYDIYRGWSAGLRDGWARRYLAGFTYDLHEFSIADDGMPPPDVMPEDRKLVYPFVGIEFVQDRFEKTTNIEQVNRTEDRFMGTRVAARLGYASESLGSDRDAWILSAAGQTGFGTSRKDSLILSAAVSSRLEQGGAENFRFDAGASFYHRQSDKRLFFATLGGTWGHNLDVDNQLLLGGDNGLRGYPLRYRGGDKLALLTLEQRYFTDWYPFRLVRVGGALFFDAGRTWGGLDDPAGDELLADVGVGLRIGNTRSGVGRMTHIDLAFPLNGGSGIKDVQLLIETRKSF